MKQLPLAMRLRERAVFESFVAGANAPGVEQLRALAAGTASGVYWLSGPPGVGKTHLLQASCALARSGGYDAAYLPLSELLALGPETLEGWQGARVVALDDLARRRGAGGRRGAADVAEIFAAGPGVAFCRRHAATAACAR